MGKPLRLPVDAGSEHPELRQFQQFDRGLDCVLGDVYNLLGFFSGDGVIAGGVGVLGLVAASPEPVKRAQAGHVWELCLDGFDDGDMASGGSGAETLLGKEGGRRLAGGVVGEGVRRLRGQSRSRLVRSWRAVWPRR